MKKIILIRHAKSSWNAPLNDIDRPLTKSGILAAHQVATTVVDLMPKAYLVWCSMAKRTTETAIIFAQNCSFPLDNIHIIPELYTFDVFDFEKIIKNCDDQCDNLVVFGHNQAITDFVNKFGSQYIDNVPTAGFVAIRFENDSWKTIENGTTENIIFPEKQLQ